MALQARKCKRGFPCGKTCISKTKNCWANLSSTNSRVAETFSQFVNRLVGIGNSNQSSIEAQLNSQINTNNKTVKALEEKVKPQIKAGKNATDLLNNLNKELEAGKKAVDLLNNLKPISTVAKEVSVEVLPDEQITNIPKLLNPGSKTINIKAETIKEEINAGNKVKAILEELKPEIAAGKGATELLNGLEQKIVAGKEVSKLLEELKPEIVAGKGATEMLENLKPKIIAGENVAKILEDLSPVINAGEEVTKILEDLKPVINAGENATKMLEALKAPVLAGEEATKILNELKPPINAGKEATKMLEDLKAPIEAGKEVSNILNELKPNINAGKEATKMLEDLKPKIEAGKEVTNILNELKPKVEASKEVTKVLEDLTSEKQEKGGKDTVLEEKLNKAKEYRYKLEELQRKKDEKFKEYENAETPEERNKLLNEYSQISNELKDFKNDPSNSSDPAKEVLNHIKEKYGQKNKNLDIFKPVVAKQRAYIQDVINEGLDDFNLLIGQNNIGNLKPKPAIKKAKIDFNGSELEKKQQVNEKNEVNAGNVEKFGKKAVFQVMGQLLAKSDPNIKKMGEDFIKNFLGKDGEIVTKTPEEIVGLALGMISDWTSLMMAINSGEKDEYINLALQILEYNNNSNN